MNFSYAQNRPGRQTMQNVRPDQRVPYENLSPLMLFSATNRRTENERLRTAPVRH